VATFLAKIITYFSDSTDWRASAHVQLAPGIDFIKLHFRQNVILQHPTVDISSKITDKILFNSNRHNSWL
jgi:hypothetical protein